MKKIQKVLYIVIPVAREELLAKAGEILEKFID